MLPVFFTSRFDYFAFQIAVTIWFIPEFFWSFVRNRSSPVQKRDRASRYVLLAGFSIGLILGIISAFRTRQDAIPWDRALLFWLGMFFMLAGVAFRWYAIRVLGKYFMPVVAIQAGQTVVEQGPYRWIRHPSYSGALITFFGLGLAFSNWLSLIAILLGACIGYSYRVHVEEQALCEALGQPYRDYMKRTRRFIPFVF